jgi:hypothetical protein
MKSLGSQRHLSLSDTIFYRSMTLSAHVSKACPYIGLPGWITALPGCG